MIGVLADEITKVLSAGGGEIDWLTTRTFITVAVQIGSVILGLVSYILIIGITLVIATELLYINIPTLQSGIMSKRNNLDNVKVKSSLDIAFRDADKALREANTVQTGRSATLIYLKYKVKAIFILGIALGLIFDPSTLLRSISNLVSPLVEIINSLVGG